ncbi:flagellar biosynthesis anti-sigma factor FlgM [Pseudoalteromonas sp. MTN2-4]|uniref:flagellar biosynthesis anti-sigma factor FlgM n=1 Tax=Pseudoalteromonas sp. MTN2-4 TaxID=3056555 RepID=UPI0036F3509E
MVNNIKGQSQPNSVLDNIKQQKTGLQKSDANVTAETAKAPQKAATDSVSLTPQAQQLKSLQEKAQQSPSFDSKKVEELKKAISEGKYQVDAEKLAKNIAAFEFDVYG